MDATVNNLGTLASRFSDPQRLVPELGDVSAAPFRTAADGTVPRSAAPWSTCAPGSSSGTRTRR